MSSIWRSGWHAIALLGIILLIAAPAAAYPPTSELKEMDLDVTVVYGAANLSDANLPLIPTLSNQRSPNTDEPLEQEEITTGASNPGIVTITRMAFAYVQRRLISYSTESSDVVVAYGADNLSGKKSFWDEERYLDTRSVVYVDANSSDINLSGEKPFWARELNPPVGMTIVNCPPGEQPGVAPQQSAAPPAATPGVAEMDLSWRGTLKKMDADMDIIYVAANLSDFNTSDWDIPVSDIIITEVTIVEPSDEELKALDAKEPKHPYTLGFVGGSFTPTERLDSRIQDKLASAGEDDYTYCFVMISGINTGAKRDALTEHGVKLLGYQFYHSHKAKIPLNRIEEIGNLSFVRWVGYAPFDLKIHPTLQKMISSGSDDEIRVYINVFDSDINEKSEKIVCNDGKTYCKCIPHGPFQNKLEEMGVTILDYEEGHGRKTFIAHATPETINRIAGLDFVLFIKTGDLCANMSGKLLGTQRSPNTDEPSEQELTTGDSNHGIVTIVRTAFAYI